MHELSIARSIVNIAEDEVRKASMQQVKKIELDIGKLSGIELESLEFVWEIAVENTVLKGATREINHIPGKARCSQCAIEFEMDQLFDPCPECRQYFNEIIQGKELKIRSLTLI